MSSMKKQERSDVIKAIMLDKHLVHVQCDISHFLPLNRDKTIENHNLYPKIWAN